MSIWICMVVPFANAAALWVFWKHRTAWWEFALPMAVSILLIAGMKLGVETAMTRDTEYWGGAAAVSQYDEPWDEEVPCTHTEYCTDKDGGSYACGTEHAYDVDNHPAVWRVVDTNGFKIRTNKARHQELSIRWGGVQFVDMRRDYHSQDGDRYQARWPGDDATLEPVTTSHSYENRVAVSASVFSYPEVDPKGLYPYPKISGFYRMPAVLGGKSVAGRDEADRILQVANAQLGRMKQLRMFLILFGPESDISTGQDQEALWKGGNKNELVVTLGVDSQGDPAWCHVFSWTEQEILKVELREAVFEGEFSLPTYATRMVELAEQRWVRKPFADFDWIEVEPPLWSTLLALFLTLAANVGLSAWIIHNRIDD